MIKKYVTVNQQKLNRVEVISEHGRELAHYNLENVNIDIQDDGKTLKVFISKNKKKEK